MRTTVTVTGHRWHRAAEEVRFQKKLEFSNNKKTKTPNTQSRRQVLLFKLRFLGITYLFWCNSHFVDFTNTRCTLFYLLYRPKIIEQNTKTKVFKTKFVKPRDDRTSEPKELCCMKGKSPRQTKTH